ncbi:MAG: TolC family protein [Ignavibacteria bacterium]
MKHILIFILFISNLLIAQQDSTTDNSKYSYTGLTDLVNAAIKTNVNLEPVDLEQKLLSTKIDQAGYQSSPMFEFMLDDLPVNLSDAGNYKVNYLQPLKLFGKLDAKESLAKINSLRPEIQKEALQIELIKMVKENYFMLSVNERLLSFNDEFKEIMHSITGSLEIKYSVGKGSQYDILKSNNEYQKLLLEEIELNNNKKIFLNNLRTLTNIDLPDDFKTKNLNILLKINPPDLDTTKLISEMRSNNTDYKLLDQQNKENKIETTISELERKPDLNLITGYKYNSGMQESFYHSGSEWSFRSCHGMKNGLML